MVIGDYEAVYDLWKRTAGMGLNDVDDSKTGIEKYLRRNPTTCFVAEKNETIIGVILSGHDGRRGYVHHMAVDEKLRGNGVGSMLLKSAMDALKAEGITKAALLVFAENEIGNAFWESKGFMAHSELLYRNRLLDD